MSTSVVKAEKSSLLEVSEPVINEFVFTADEVTNTVELKVFGELKFMYFVF